MVRSLLFQFRNVSQVIYEHQGENRSVAPIKLWFPLRVVDCKESFEG